MGSNVPGLVVSTLFALRVARRADRDPTTAPYIQADGAGSWVTKSTLIMTTGFGPSACAVYHEAKTAVKPFENATFSSGRGGAVMVARKERLALHRLPCYNGAAIRQQRAIALHCICWIFGRHLRMLAYAHVCSILHKRIA